MKRNFRSKKWGSFGATLTENVMGLSGSENILLLAGKGTTERLLVPEFLLSDARQVMKRGGGDRMLDDVARLCIIHEVALEHCS